MKEKLSIGERCLLTAIFENIEKDPKKICRKTNRYFAKKLEVSERTIIRYIRKLYNLYYIDVVWYNNGERDIKKGGN